MQHNTFHWLKYQGLKTKLCLLTVLLIVAVMMFVGYVVLEQQRQSLLVQMKETGRFLVKNLAKNAIGPLLDEDKLSLNNLIKSFEERDTVEGNPAKFTQQEFDEFVGQFFLEDKLQRLSPFLKKDGKNIVLDVEQLSGDRPFLTAIGSELLQDILTIITDLNSPEEYEAFFTKYSWTRSLVESLTPLDDVERIARLDEIPEKQRNDLIDKLADRIFNEILGYVKNPLVGYAIILDKENVIRAHPDIERVGETYAQPEDATFLEEIEEFKLYRMPFKGEWHFEFEAPILLRAKNVGTANLGSVHLGLREEYLLKEIRAARKKILYIAILAVVLGSIGSYALASLLVNPVKALVRDAEILGGGNLDHRIEARTHDEVGVLAVTLDDTRVKLKSAQQKLVASERLARELEIAKEIQMALLPKETPSLEHVEIGTLYRAAAQVGGDLYDFFWVSENELGIVVADVSGKGVPGSLVMTMAKAVIRAKAVKADAPDHTLPADLGGDPASVIRKTNQMIAQDIKKGMFITANYGILNIQTLRFQFVSAGHNDTLVYNSRTNELREYNPKGIALGLDKGTIFDMMLQDQEIVLSKGDLLIQYTDGITEAMNEDREEFGEERLKEAIRKYAHHSVDDFLAALDQEIRAFTEGFAQSDDITAVAIKMK